MAFTEAQVKNLEAKLNSKHVRTRRVQDSTLAYVEGWRVISEANWLAETMVIAAFSSRLVGRRRCRRGTLLVAKVGASFQRTERWKIN